MPDRVDVIVLGMGVGGEDVANSLAESGLNVVGIEKHLVGGECPYYGCVPTKMMIRGDDMLAEVSKAYADPERRQGHLDLYRSGDFAKLEPYRGKLAALDVPTLIVWGAKDEFAPAAGGYRFHKEIPGSTLVVLDDAGHFLMEDDPARVTGEITKFLTTQAVPA